MKILVTGGAGYIGSHCVNQLLKNGYEVVVVDNLSKGHKDAVGSAKLYIGNIGDKVFMNKVFSEEKVDGVIHFAAYSIVPESMKVPDNYYENNVVCTLRLLESMIENNVKHIVFSSTAATYGEPERIPITEDMATTPTNTYGETKLSIEKMMKWFDTAYGLKFAALRYFNACGADEEGKIGEDHSPETHLIPLVLQVATGKREKIMIYGNDYATPDGTCVRDYVHVNDLISAHILAMKYLKNGGTSDSFNLGSGAGFSVNEIIESARKVTGHPIPAEIAERRAGDPASLIASSKKAKKILGWKPQYDNIDYIIKTAYNWHKNHLDGYGDK